MEMQNIMQYQETQALSRCFITSDKMFPDIFPEYIYISIIN